MSDLEQRVRWLEQQLSNRTPFDLQQLRQQMAALQNQQRLGGGGYGGGGGSSTTFLFCRSTTGNLPAGGTLTGQTIATRNAGADQTVNSNGTIENITGNDIPSGSMVFVGTSADGTYGAISVAC
jgi:hypothetical protein